MYQCNVEKRYGELSRLRINYQNTQLGDIKCLIMWYWLIAAFFAPITEVRCLLKLKTRHDSCITPCKTFMMSISRQN